MTGPQLTSTVPAAIARLVTHLETVAAAHPDLALGVYVGRPIQTVANNFVSIGDPLGQGQMLTQYLSDWQGAKQTPSLRRTEDYGLHCVLRTWNGNIDPVARITEAFTVISTLMNVLAEDIRGGADVSGHGGVLSPSGLWAVNTIDNTSTGPIDGKGWGVVIEFDVAVEGVVLTAAP